MDASVKDIPCLLQHILENAGFTASLLLTAISAACTVLINLFDAECSAGCSAGLSLGSSSSIKCGCPGFLVAQVTFACSDHYQKKPLGGDLTQARVW